MPMTARAHEGETLDQLVWRATGGGASAVELVLTANPGLAGLGPFLPENHAVLIPDTATAALEPLALVQLWD